jgi:hypothetical protein
LRIRNQARQALQTSILELDTNDDEDHKLGAADLCVENAQFETMNLVVISRAFSSVANIAQRVYIIMSSGLLTVDYRPNPPIQHTD